VILVNGWDGPRRLRDLAPPAEVRRSALGLYTAEAAGRSGGVVKLAVGP
jgi:hypothetical protein